MSIFFYILYVTHLLYKQSHLDGETGRREKGRSRQIQTERPGGSDSKCCVTQHCQGEVDLAENVDQNSWVHRQMKRSQ